MQDDIQTTTPVKPKKSLLARYPTALIAVAILVICAAGLVAQIAAGMINLPAAPAASPTPLQPTAAVIQPASEGETLVLVTDFTGDASADRLYEALKAGVEEAKQSDVRVERLSGVAPQSAEEAIALGETYVAALVSWGKAADGGMLEAHFEVVDTQTKVPVSFRFEYGTLTYQPPSFSAVIDAESSEEFDYLTLVCLSQITYFSEDYVRTNSLLNRMIATPLDTALPRLNFKLLHLYQAYNYMARGSTEIARDELSSAINLDPDFALAYYVRGLILGYEEAEHHEAHADFTKAIELDPKFALAYFERGRSFFSQNTDQESLDDLTKVIELDPEFAYAYYERGSDYFEQDDLDAAMADFIRVIELEPEFADGYSQRGRVYYEKEDYHAAALDFSRAIKADPESYYAYYLRGLANYMLDLPGAAMADYTKSIQLYDSWAPPWAERGRLYYEEGNYFEAKVNLDKAIDLRIDTYTLHLRALVNHELDDLKGELLDYNTIIERDPDYKDAYIGRGNLYIVLDYPDLALADFDKAIELDPDYATPYNERGMVYHEQGDLEAALADFDKAIELWPTYAEAYHNRAKIYFAMGSYADALPNANKAVSHGDRSAHYTLGLIYQAQGENDKAIKELTRYLKFYEPDAPEKDDARQRIIDMGGTPPE